ncbi:MaoC/PaaZ C-terminal domain-containing protein [Caballeronia sp. LZ029]|uniref:MaoC/PaaZ C-terminal domain-containing protein n=1 Tax=Caballeronia sp. LZ029 TaxID=3038564 RepID=UPI0028595302|nr:MaoC/PaaZ C-terminal domain-containing protein [Caballeronia sp. LZ029]MDR5744951.1 MaoC/PaaZ C-terminal domain-containing protein [Caballeronia sp. LZ029]
MAIDYQKLKNWPFDDVHQTYTERDSALYALSVGFGVDPLDTRALKFTYGPEMAVAPTMAAVLGFPGQWMRNPESGIDYVKVVHGEQRVTLMRPLPAAATIIGRTRVQSIVDKGEGKGAQVLMSRDVIDASNGEVLARVEQLNFCRGDGGFTARGQPHDAPLPAPSAVPETQADIVCDLPVRAEGALLYRLNGDVNPLHVDPATARAAGFERPVLHGLATYGIAGHAILRAVCGYDAARLRMLYTRFSSPAFPGETIRVEIWRQSGTALRFRARSVERDVVVLNNGEAEITEA